MLFEQLFADMLKFAEYCLSETEVLTLLEYGFASLEKLWNKQMVCTVFSLNESGNVYTPNLSVNGMIGGQDLYEYCLDDGSTIQSKSSDLQIEHSPKEK
ncbi:hypothetical protein U9R62_06865 [Cylindrospermopsis raciborskii DSH]|uniref:hypothetical protein n=1 Tax=Cylindrospermopsis raciborskii TaxID=77022 RepID=UPI002EDA7F53